MSDLPPSNDFDFADWLLYVVSTCSPSPIGDTEFLVRSTVPERVQGVGLFMDEFIPRVERWWRSWLRRAWLEPM